MVLVMLFQSRWRTMPRGRDWGIWEDCIVTRNQLLDWVTWNLEQSSSLTPAIANQKKVRNPIEPDGALLQSWIDGQQTGGGGFKTKKSKVERCLALLRCTQVRRISTQMYTRRFSVLVFKSSRKWPSLFFKILFPKQAGYYNREIDQLQSWWTQRPTMSLGIIPFAPQRQ